MVQPYLAGRPHRNAAAIQRSLFISLAVVSCFFVIGCGKDSTHIGRDGSSSGQITGETRQVGELSEKSPMTTKWPDKEEDQYTQARRRMVASQLRGRDITNVRVLGAMANAWSHGQSPSAPVRS